MLQLVLGPTSCVETRVSKALLSPEPRLAAVQTQTDRHCHGHLTKAETPQYMGLVHQLHKDEQHMKLIHRQMHEDEQLLMPPQAHQYQIRNHQAEAKGFHATMCLPPLSACGCEHQSLPPVSLSSCSVCGIDMGASRGLNRRRSPVIPNQLAALEQQPDVWLAMPASRTVPGNLSRASYSLGHVARSACFWP